MNPYDYIPENFRLNQAQEAQLKAEIEAMSPEQKAEEYAAATIRIATRMVACVEGWANCALAGHHENAAAWARELAWHSRANLKFTEAKLQMKRDAEAGGDN
jgi:hypothetical protein